MVEQEPALAMSLQQGSAIALKYASDSASQKRRIRRCTQGRYSERQRKEEATLYSQPERGTRKKLGHGTARRVWKSRLSRNTPPREGGSLLLGRD